MTQGFAKITPVSFLAYCCVLLPQREELVKIFLGESEIHLHVVVLFKNEKKKLFHSYRFHYLFSISSNNSPSPEQQLHFKRKPTKAFRKPVSATFCACSCQGLISCVIRCLFNRILSMI